MKKQTEKVQTTVFGKTTEKDLERLKKEASTIELTLESFGIRTRVVEINVKEWGIEYCIEIELGTSIDDILKHGKDLALALASSTGRVNIQAPIPNRSLVGITVPYGPTKIEEAPYWRGELGGILLLLSEGLRNLAVRIIYTPTKVGKNNNTKKESEGFIGDAFSTKMRIKNILLGVAIGLLLIIPIIFISYLFTGI